MALRWDQWILDIPARRVVGAEGPVHMEPQVFDVLAYLVENRKRVVPKEELLDEIWGDQFVSESALTSRIKSARRALEDDGRTQKYIRNVHGRGYQFVGEVEADRDSVETLPSSPRFVDIARAISLDDDFPFVGRDAEFALARETLESPEGGLVFIGGEPGIGKSRLAVEVAERLRSEGAMVCAGRCEEHLSSGLQGVRDAVSQLADASPAEFRTWASGFEGYLVSIMPSLVRHIDADPMPTDVYTALDVLLTLVDRVAEEARLLILLDDLQWADEPTRVFISRLRRRLIGRRLFVMATFRSTSVDLLPAVSHWLAEEVRRPGSVRIDLGRLDPGSVRSLVTAVMGGDQAEMAHGVASRTDGHSLFLVESLRGLQLGEKSSASIRQIVTARLQRLPDQAQDLVRAGAVLGHEFSYRLAAIVAGMDDEVAVQAVDTAVGAELLHHVGSSERLRFSHVLVPEAVRDEMSRLLAARLNHRCVEALGDSGASELVIAYHALDAIPVMTVGEAVERCRGAAKSAVNNHEYDAAIQLLEAVLRQDLPARVRAEVLLQVGWAGNAAGRAAQASTRFEEAAELGRTCGWDDIFVDAAIGHYGLSPFRAIRNDSTLRLLAEADERLGDVRSLPKARVTAKTAAFSQFMSALATRDDMTRQALDMVPDATLHERMELLEFRAIVLSNPVGVGGLAEVDAELESLRERLGVYAADASVPETRMFMLAMGDELRAAAQPDPSRIRTQPIAEWRDLTLHGTLSALEGDFDTARELCDEAAAIGEQYWGVSSPYLHLLGHVIIAALTGDWARPVELGERLLRIDENRHLILTAAWANAAGDNTSRARQLVDKVRIDRLGSLGEHILGGNSLTAAAQVAILLDDDRLAEAADAALAPFQHLMLGLPWACSLAAADSLSHLAHRRGDEVAASAFASRAQDVYQRLRAPALRQRMEG